MAAASILFGWAWTEPLVVALIGLMIVRIAWGLARPAWTGLRAPAQRFSDTTGKNRPLRSRVHQAPLPGGANAVW